MAGSYLTLATVDGKNLTRAAVGNVQPSHEKTAHAKALIAESAAAVRAYLDGVVDADILELAHSRLLTAGAELTGSAAPARAAL